MRPIIYPYKMGSKTARALSKFLRDLRCKRVRMDGKYKYFRNHLIINWGQSLLPRWHEPRVKYVNHPDNVNVASHKLLCLQKLQEHDIPIPDFTTDSHQAVNWLNNGDILYARQLLRASGGRGIRVIDNNVGICRASLYTKRIAPRGEYRVHVFGNSVIDYQKKRRNSTALDNNTLNELVRNHDNGWIFCRENLPEIKDNLFIAVRAVEALGLTFGAVDIIRGEDRKSYVLEVNTAPGLEGTTLTKYIGTLKRYINEYQFY